MKCQMIQVSLCISSYLFQRERRGCAAEVTARLPQVEVGQGVPQRRHRRQR